MTSLAEFWPPFGLTLSTPRLTLRAILDEDIPAAVEAARSGIHPPGKSPFSRPWAEMPAEKLAPNMAQWYWRCRGNFTPEEWTLLLAVWHEDEFLGVQDIAAKNFAALKTVGTGSWLKQSAQGRGFGKEMRAAVVSFAFDYLDAEVAESEAAVWNSQSLGVSASLGYQPNGIVRDGWGDTVQEVQKVRLTPATFKRPDWTLTVQGHRELKSYLGLRGPVTGPVRD
ncbi:GNAT family N-acetyltransferase [Paenarthrobacter ilicis]|uniref:RimJ/RimL family protein N-acetyltransferase n=1 Tax=Paenarthrobacter ilicis TaxID=43665 RepID=A0ABX0TI49_9MICC|nr:GNAT family protein [Paenarthrobacter ilicis]MBM7792536.1 RimJ/RimL family protein N-acetyltransferase [Paenarthrobacter ilicis]NIJ00880.1 RimJ/RimL family protein N-acetyltransferase [Paenarthrobacter ilicis]